MPAESWWNVKANVHAPTVDGGFAKATVTVDVGLPPELAGALVQYLLDAVDQWRITHKDKIR